MGEISDDIIGGFYSDYENELDQITEKIIWLNDRKKQNKNKKDKYKVIINGIMYRKFFGKYVEMRWAEGDFYMKSNGELAEISDEDVGEHIGHGEVCYRKEEDCY